MSAEFEPGVGCMLGHQLRSRKPIAQYLRHERASYCWLPASSGTQCRTGARQIVGKLCFLAPENAGIGISVGRGGGSRK